MIELLEQHHQPLGDLCRHFHVARLEVFGSAANGEFDPAATTEALAARTAPGKPPGPGK